MDDRQDDNILLDAEDDDWAWRRRLRQNPATAKLYRLAVAVVGLIIVVTGLLLVPLPGPGWLIVFAGLAVWASEFEWAQKVLHRVKANVRAWDTWVRRQPKWVQGLTALATAVLVLAVIYLVLRISGVPAFLPNQLEDFLRNEADL